MTAVTLAYVGTGVAVLSVASPAAAAAGDAAAAAWGQNYSGQLGNSSNADSNVPVQVADMAGVSQVAAGFEYSLALKSDGTVRAWGANSFGQLGNNTYAASNVPVQVSDLSGVTQVAAGYDHSLALKADGTVRAWGANGSGQLGNNTYAPSNVPVQVSGLSGVTQVAAGYQLSVALKADGTVWAWGYNYSGQLGNGTYAESSVPVQVSGLSGVTQVAAGYFHGLALKGDGTLWAWGQNNYGQLGDSTNANSNLPVRVGGLSGVTQVAGGVYHSLAVVSDGTVSAWGDNNSGQLGNSSTAPSSVPVQVFGLSGATQVAGGYDHSLAATNDGTIWAWGGNNSGQLGDNSYASSSEPVRVSGLSGTQVAAGGYHSLAVEAPVVSVAPASLAFGEVPAGASRTLDVTMTNMGAIPVRVPSVSVTGPNAGLFTPTVLCAGPVPVGGTCEVAIRFAPTTAGAKSATLAVDADQLGGPALVPLTGTGTGAAISFDPAALDFGKVRIGASKTLEVTVTSVGGTPLTLEAANLVGDSFHELSLSGPTLPTTLDPGSSATFHLTFTPTGSPGARAMVRLNFNDNTASSTDTVWITATATQPAATPSPTAESFPAQQVGTTSAYRHVTLTNSGSAPLTVTSVTTSGDNPTDFTMAGQSCTGAPVAPGDTCGVDVAFAPTVTGPRTAVLTFTDDAPASPQTVALSGDSVNPVATANPTSVAFDATIVGASSASRLVTVTNTGVGDLHPMGLTLSGADPGQFTLSDNTCSGATIHAGATCTFRVAFAPTATGTRTAEALIPSDAANSPAPVPLSGTGVQPAATAAPNPLAFGKTLVDSTGTGSVTVTNTGTGTLTISSATTTAGGPFAASGPTLPVDVSPGASVAFTVTYTPTAVVTDTGTLTVVANDGPAGAPEDTTVSLTGRGVQPGASVTPGSLSFEADVGTLSASQQVTVNSTGTAPLTLTSAVIAGSYPGDYRVTSNTCTSPVAVGSSCTIWVAFQPTAVGARPGLLRITGDAPQLPTDVTLAGNGTQTSGGGGANLSLSDTASAVQVRSGGKVTFTITVTNTGTAAAGAFTVSDTASAPPATETFVKATSRTGTCTGLSAGQTLGRETCSFTGLAAGATAQVTLTSSVTGSSGDTTINTATLTGGGTGTASATVTVK